MPENREFFDIALPPGAVRIPCDGTFSCKVPPWCVSAEDRRALFDHIGNKGLAIRIHSDLDERVKVEIFLHADLNSGEKAELLVCLKKPALAEEEK